MRILYAFQGTGNGHHTRAVELLPELRKVAEVDVLVSGAPPEKAFHVPVDHRYHGVGFRFGQKGGVDLRGSFRDLDSKNFFREIKRVPVREYDLVLNDFEPVTAWACRQQDVPVVGMSHQAAVLHPASPKPHRVDWFSSKILEHYAPTPRSLGFHFEAYAEGIYTPVIRQVVRDLARSNEGHITVYLPAYSSSNIHRVLKYFPRVQFEVFSPRWNKPFQQDHIAFHPADADAFLHSMAGSRGVISGAGFETPAEALFLGKPVLAVPMHGQLEQQCNAAALREMGVPTIPQFTPNHLDNIKAWLTDPTTIVVDYPDQIPFLIDAVLTPSAITA